MFPSNIWLSGVIVSFPRVSGDVSTPLPDAYQTIKFSSRERGCFLENRSIFTAYVVFPA